MNDQRAYIDRRPRWRRRLDRVRRDPWGIVMDAVGERTPGLGGPPLCWYSRKHDNGYSTLLLFSGDDGRSIELRRRYRDSDDEAVCYEVHRGERLFLLRYILWAYLVDWFGLRTRVYFTALTRHLTAVTGKSPQERGIGH